MVTIVGGIVGGSFIFIILLLLLIIIKCTIGHKLKRPNIDANLSKFLLLHFLFHIDKNCVNTN